MDNVNADETVMQADLEDRMRELSAAGGGEMDMGGARVLITDPPLTVPEGVVLSGCRFQLHLQAATPDEVRTVSYRLPRIETEGTGGADIRVDRAGHLTVEVHGGSVTGADSILLPDGGVLAEVPPVA